MDEYASLIDPVDFLPEICEILVCQELFHVDVHGRIGDEESHMSVANNHSIEKFCSVWHVSSMEDFLLLAASPIELALIWMVVCLF